MNILHSFIHILCFLFFYSPSFNDDDHPIHIAITELNYNATNRSIEISHKFFLDDIEKGILDEGGPNLKIGSDQEIGDYQSIIYDYIDRHFELKVNNKEVSTPTYIGTEHNLEAIWVYVEYTKVKKIKSLEINNDLLMTSFSDQKNMVHCKNNDQKKSLLFVEGETMQTIEW